MTEEDQAVDSQPEPTVLDWVKSLFKLKPIPIPEPAEITEQVEFVLPPVEIKPVIEVSQEELEVPPHAAHVKISLKHLRFPIALFFGLFAQFALEAKPRNIIVFVAIYLFAGIIIGWATWAGDFGLPFPKSTEEESQQEYVKVPHLIAGAVLSLLTYFASTNNQFTSLNLLLWISSLIFFLIAFWEGQLPYTRFWAWVKSKLEGQRLDLQIQPWHIVIAASISLIVFFRFTQLERVPYEMWSDQAEKLYDVMDVLDGKYSIFFTSNLGREPMQFYLAAATVKILGTGISFETLKIGTILAGLLTLPYLYLFAKEFGGRYVGLAAVLLAGVAYWPNVISRLGLRFPLYPLFVAPALYYLLRGIRLRQRNDFILCGFAVGLGFHGYSPARIIPFAVAVGVLIYLIYKGSKGRRSKTFTWLILAGIIALAVFMPLLGAVTDMMDVYLGRMISRIAPTEQPLTDSPLMLFAENLWRGLRMFAWDNGGIWINSIPFRPALDWVTGALFHLGVIIVLVRFIRERQWQDLFLLIMIPVLMLPSILALAFPVENPALNRASGAIIPVFTIAAIALVSLPKWAKETFQIRMAQWIAISVSLVLFIIAASLNYNLVFNTFVEHHRQSTWNTSEIGKVIRGFANTIGSYETAHVIPYEHWVDTRLVGINAGDPEKDYAVSRDNLDQIPPEPDRPQLFIFKPEDTTTLEKLRELYPNGVVRHGDSELEGRDFILYYVFPDESMDLDVLMPEQ